MKKNERQGDSGKGKDAYSRYFIYVFTYFTQSLTPHQPQTNTNKKHIHTDVITCYERAGPDEWKRCQNCCTYLPGVVSLSLL